MCIYNMSCYSMILIFFYDDNVTFHENGMLWCHDKGTEKAVILGSAYMDNLKTLK
jgi:hypothetical protein